MGVDGQVGITVGSFTAAQGDGVGTAGQAAALIFHQ